MSWAAWPLRALAERACKLGRAGWGRVGGMLSGLASKKPPVVADQSSLPGAWRVVIKLSNPYKYDGSSTVFDARNRTGR